MRVALPNDTKGRLVALRAGIIAAGDVVVAADEDADCAVGSNWGAVLALRKKYDHVAVCECGYLGNRNWWCSISWDGLNGRGRHGLAPERPEPELEPWRERSDGYALILGQVPTDWAVRVALEELGYTSYNGLFLNMRAALKLRGYDVRVREHPEVVMSRPLPPESPRDRKLRRIAREPKPKAQPSLRAELEGARLAVTLNSTAAIEAVCMGVPTVVYDRGSMAGRVSSTLGGPFGEPTNRRTWVNQLARMQWSMAELEDGTAWRAVRSLAFS